MDLTFLKQVVLELSASLIGGFAGKIHQPLPREIVVRVRVPGEREKKLALSADPRLGRIHLTDLTIPNPPSPPRFCAYLRAHFSGSRILEVSCATDDRVVRIAGVRRRQDQTERRDLILELLGRDSNIILVDGASNRIMECLHRIPEKETGTRIVLPGEEYRPPPKGGQRDAESPASDTRRSIMPGIQVDDRGKRTLTLEVDPTTGTLFGSALEAADAYYGEVLQSQMVASLKRELAAPLKSRIRSLERRLQKIEADRKRAERFAVLQHDGELLKGNLNLVKKGMKSVTVRDWNTGEERTITLEPALDRIANMERLFAKSAKGRRGQKMVELRISQTLEEKAALEDQLFFVEDAADLDDLNGLVDEILVSSRKPDHKRHRKRTQAKKDAEGSFHRFQSPGGHEVLVGRSGKGNEDLLRKKARKGDLWFHVKDRPGAHVILPVRQGEPVTVEDKEFAAGLAVHFSKARGAGQAEVIVADVKDLRRPKGALPGQVTVRSFVTIRAAEVIPIRNRESKIRP